MKKKNMKLFLSYLSIFLCILIILPICLFSFFTEKSVLPIENDKVAQIQVSICPQDTGIYTVLDDNRINEIVSVINNLSVEKYDSPVWRDGEYYYSIRLYFVDGDIILVSFDRNTISLSNETYIADTKALHNLLEKTYHDNRNGNI